MKTWLLSLLAVLTGCKEKPEQKPPASPPAVTGETWPQFRGPTGQGTSTATGLPLSWNERKNVTWKTPLPGEGWSSPVYAGGQIWMTTATDGGRSLRALCVDFSSGKLLHDVEVFHVETPAPKHQLNSYASPTPVLDGGRVYVHFGAEGTACLDTGTGTKIWENRELKIDHENGAGGSFVVWQDKVIIPCDGRDQQFEAALDKQTGKLAWKTPRSKTFTKPPDMRKAYATPLIIEVDGQPQSITNAADRLYALDPASGKELWWVDYAGFSNVARPITGHGLLFVPTGFRNSHIWAIRLGGNKGDCTETHVVWKHTNAVPHQPSPVLLGDRIYTVNDSGIASCLNALDGQQIWSERIGGEFSASPLAADERIYFFDRTGKTTILAPGDQFVITKTNKLDAGFMASPAVVGRALILRTKAALYRIEER